MAEKRTAKSTTAEDPGPVPRARTEEPEQPADQPAEQQRTKAAEPAKATKATKATKSAKAAKATKAAKAAKTTEAGSAVKGTKAAEPAKAPVKKAARKPATKAGEPAKAPAAKAAKVAATKSTEAPPTRAAAVPAPAVPGAWSAAVREALAQPGQPARRLAELAVAELGPRAAAWAGWLRETYPDPPAHGIARLALHQARQLGWALALAEAAGGPVAAALSLPAAAWVRVTLVLRIAAAYGHDPADPRRAAELGELLERLTTWSHRSRVISHAVAQFRRRLTPARAADRLLYAAAEHDREIERLAHRAARFYRSQERMSASNASISSPATP